MCRRRPSSPSSRPPISVSTAWTNSSSRSDRRMMLARYIGRRLVTMVLTLLVISALVFFIIKLPPGDYLSNQIAELGAEGDASSLAKAEFLRHQFGLDLPVWHQYLAWIGLMPGPNGWSGLLQGNWGWSFEYNQPVNVVVGQALVLTLVVNL